MRAMPVGLGGANAGVDYVLYLDLVISDAATNTVDPLIYSRQDIISQRHTVVHGLRERPRVQPLLPPGTIQARHHQT